MTQPPVPAAPAQPPEATQAPPATAASTDQKPTQVPDEALDSDAAMAVRQRDAQFQVVEEPDGSDFDDNDADEAPVPEAPAPTTDQAPAAPAPVG